MKCFDYVYYQIYNWYQKRDAHPWIYAIGFISILQSFLVLNIYILINELFEFQFLSGAIEKSIFIFIFLLFIIFNTYRYKNLDLFRKLERIYNPSSKGRILVIGAILVIISFPFIFGFLRHNLDLI